MRRHDRRRRARGRAAPSRTAVRERTGLTCSIGVTPNKLLVEDRLRARQARRPDAARATTTCPRASGRCRRARSTASARRRRPSSRRSASRTIGELAARRPGVPARSTSARASAPGCTRRRTAATSGRSSRSASRSRSAARRRSTATCTRCATAPSSARSSPSCASSSPATWRARATPAKTIGIKLRFDDFKTVTRDLTLPAHTLDAREIRRAAGECLKRVDLTRRLRLLGVRAGALARLADLVAPLAPSEPAAGAQAPPAARDAASVDYSLPLFDDAIRSRSAAPAA